MATMDMATMDKSIFDITNPSTDLSHFEPDLRHFATEALFFRTAL